jgi:hypothetical protein
MKGHWRIQMATKGYKWPLEDMKGHTLEKAVSAAAPAISMTCAM